MNFVMYAIGAVAIIIGAVELLVFGNDNSAIRFIYLYLAISTALSGVLYLGFGSLLTLLQNLVENTAPLREAMQRAAARASAGTNPAEPSHPDREVAYPTAQRASAGNAAEPTQHDREVVYQTAQDRVDQLRYPKTRR